MFNCTISVSIPEAGHYLIRDKALPYLCIPDNSQWLKSPRILSFLVVCLFFAPGSRGLFGLVMSRCPGLCVSQDRAWGRAGDNAGRTLLRALWAQVPTQPFYQRPPLALVAGFPQEPPRGGVCSLGDQCFAVANWVSGPPTRAQAWEPGHGLGAHREEYRGHLRPGWHPGGQE